MELENWQTGSNCKMNYLDRIDAMNEWLLKNKMEILSKPDQAEKDEVVVGFIDL